MLFDKNYSELIEILGKYDENFLKDYNKFISRFPENILKKAQKGKECGKQVKNARFSFFWGDRYDDLKINLSILENDKYFAQLQVYLNGDIDLMSSNNILFYRNQKGESHLFKIYIDNDKKILKVTFDNRKTKSDDRLTITEHVLSDKEFDFIVSTSSEFIEKEKTKTL